MPVQIRQQLVTSRAKTFAGVNSRRYITVHETANTAPGTNAAAHANLQSRGNVREASWHWQVDDREAVQSFPHSVQCWHAGDGRGPGNTSSIGVEICVNADGDFRKAVENAATLVRKIMAEEGIPLERVVQHSRWSGKNCPTFLRNGSRGITWNDFLRLVAGASLPAPTPAQKPAPAPKAPSTGGVNVAALPVLKKGSTGIAVRRLQGLLLANGFSVGKAGIDGSFGPATDAAVRAFQTRHPDTGTNGKPDGHVGPKTWSRLLGVG